MFDKNGIIKFLTILLLIYGIGLSDTVVANRLSSKDNTAKGFYVGVCTHFSQDKGIIAERPWNKGLVEKLSKMLQ